MFLTTFISVALSASAALAQTDLPATPAATPTPALEAAASTPAPASAPAKKKEKHGISISIGDDPANADDDAKSKLTPEQLFEIELARAKNGGRDNLVEILVPAAFFSMILAIVAITVWARFRRSRMLHETVRLFADRGQALPPEVFAGTPLPPRPKSDLRRGIFWSAVGLGLIGYFLADHDSSWGTGFIPLFIGIGYLVAWKLESPPKTGAGV